MTDILPRIRWLAPVFTAGGLACGFLAKPRCCFLCCLMKNSRLRCCALWFGPSGNYSASSHLASFIGCFPGRLRPCWKVAFFAAVNAIPNEVRSDTPRSYNSMIFFPAKFSERHHSRSLRQILQAYSAAYAFLWAL